MTFSNNCSYEGQWQAGKLKNGTITYTDGSTYRGPVKGNKRHGYGGELLWKSGYKQTGNFEDDELVYGQQYWPDGSHYEGDWIRGTRHGIGALHIKGCGIYRGPFVNNLKHGYGEFKYDSGAIYKGEFKIRKNITFL